MGAHKKTSLVVSVIFSLLSFFISQQNVSAQDFLKKFLSSSLIKKGRQFKSDGDYPSAITSFTKSIKKEPGNLEAHYQLGLIFEDILHNYDKAVSIYKNVITLSKSLTPTGTDEELKEFNTLIANAGKGINRITKKKFESIEKPTPSIYIIVKSDKKVFKEPQKNIFSINSIYKTVSNANEFSLLSFNDDWYQINIPSIGLGWIRGRNVLKILLKEKDATETSLTGKAAQYDRFVNLYPNSRFASKAKERAYNIYYELAKNEDTINSYSVYLEKYPDGKEADEFRLRKDELTFQDKDFFNNVERLQAWIDSNPESAFLDKAKIRVEELTFTQAKDDKDVGSLEIYLAKYPQGKYVTDTKQIIEDLKYEHAKVTDTVDSYRKYMDEYPNGKYVEDVIKGIYEKEFATLLNSKDINLLVEHLKSETNEERIELVESRIEELYYKKAYEADNDAEAIKLHENYLQKYQAGLYEQEAKTRIEELSFNIAVKENTKEAYYGFTKKYPQGKFYQKAINSIEILEFNIAKDENSIEAYKKFLKEYPKGKYSQTAKNRIGELVFDSVKKTGTVSAYTKFIKQYPECKYAEEAKLRIDQLHFEYYQKKDTLKAYKKFVKKYPENRYVNEAKEKISQRPQTDKRVKRKPRISIGLIIIGILGIGFLAALIIRLKDNVRESKYTGKEAIFTEEPSSTINTRTQKIITKTCPCCKNVTVPDKLFCIWCETYIPNPKAGKKAEFFKRMSATTIDPFIILILCSVIKVNVVCSIVVILYLVFFFWLLSKGMTPGKFLLGENVVDKLNGLYPGYWRMLLREVIVKFVSLLAFGIGYPWLWALWDKNNQMWHDKIAGTVVVHTH